MNRRANLCYTRVREQWGPMMAFGKGRWAGTFTVGGAFLLAASSAATAGDGRSMPKLDLDPPQSAQVYSEPAKAVDDLEKQRAAVSQKSKSPVSLSVSGWVSQQVEITRGR